MMSDETVHAAAAVTVNLLNRAVNGELRQLSTESCSGSSCGPFQIHRAAAIVARLLKAAADKKVPENARLAWTEKALLAASLLIDDVLSMAITYAVRGSDAECPRSTHVWTPSAIRTTCRIVRDVTDAAARKAPTIQDQPLPPQTPQLPTVVTDDAIGDRLALEEEGIARSSARFDHVGLQPSSLALEPSDLITINSNINSNPNYNETKPESDWSAEVDTAADNVNDNNATAAGTRGSGGLLRQLFGRRRRNI